jgi:hypothetical protein
MRRARRKPIAARRRSTKAALISPRLPGMLILRTGGKRQMPGKRVQFDPETWHALDLLARDRMMDFQELADEAFRDLLRKHGRPTDLKSALRQSAGQSADILKLPTEPKRTRGRRKDG